MNSQDVIGSSVPVLVQMDAINVIINLRIESDRRSYQEPLVSGDVLRKAADEMLKEAEYNLYELIDNALDKWTQDKGGE